jgi:hypothetical protein
MFKYLLFATALLVTGCGGGSADVACNVVLKTGTVTIHTCTELSGLSSSQIPTQKSSCSSAGGTLVDSCSTSGEIGVCAVTQGSETIVLFSYSDDGTTAAQGQANCQLIKGTWTGT